MGTLMTGRVREAMTWRVGAESGDEDRHAAASPCR
jgi:hypothetical protein